MEEQNWKPLSEILDYSTNTGIIEYKIKFKPNEQNEQNEKNNLVGQSKDQIFNISLHNSIKKIMDGNWNVFDVSSGLINIRNFIQESQYTTGKITNTIGNNAMKVLDNIETLCEPIYKDFTLCDLLIKVWNFCIEYSINTKIIFVNELSECVENNEIVCTKGKILHIINSLNGIVKGIKIFTKEDLNIEMMNKASVIQKSVYETLSEKAKKIIDNGMEKLDDEDDEYTIIYFEHTVRKKIKKVLYEDYVINNRLLTPEQLKDTIKEWIDKIF